MTPKELQYIKDAGVAWGDKVIWTNTIAKIDGEYPTRKAVIVGIHYRDIYNADSIAIHVFDENGQSFRAYKGELEKDNQ